MVVMAGGDLLHNIMFFMVPNLLCFCGYGSGLSSDATKTPALMVIQIIMRIKGAGWSSYSVTLCRLSVLIGRVVNDGDVVQPLSSTSQVFGIILDCDYKAVIGEHVVVEGLESTAAAAAVVHGRHTMSCPLSCETSNNELVDGRNVSYSQTEGQTD